MMQAVNRQKRGCIIHRLRNLSRQSVRFRGVRCFFPRASLRSIRDSRCSRGRSSSSAGMSDACNMVGDGDLDAPQHDLDAAVELFSTTGVCAPPTPTRHATAITTATATAIVTADATPACWRSLPRQVSASSETCWRLTSSTGFMRPTHGAPRRSTPA